MELSTLDHVALWVADRDTIADFATQHLGMHVIDRTEKFTLIGSNARRGKVTLFVAEGPRERGALRHVALRVNDLEQALAQLPEGHPVERPRDGEAYFDVADVVDAANTFAVFVWGPERVKLEYVEHKPEFSLT